MYLTPSSSSSSSSLSSSHGKTSLHGFRSHDVLLTQDIEDLRNQGVSGEEIVERLAQGSKNFGNKTEFAQKKWLKRKAKKYCPYGIVRRPCASTICEVTRCLGTFFSST